MKQVERDLKEPYIDPDRSIVLNNQVKKEIQQEDEAVKYQKETEKKFTKFTQDNPDAINPHTQKSINSQNKHFRNTPEYKLELQNGKYKSYFDETKITPDKLNQFVLSNLNNIEWLKGLNENEFKGTLEYEFDIAYNVSEKTHEITSTNMIKIHFSKKGFHSVPIKKVKK